MQKDGKVLLVLTEARVRLKWRAGVDGVESGGVARWCARVQVVQRFSGPAGVFEEVRAGTAEA